jgi:DNA relaxase NicK
VTALSRQIYRDAGHVAPVNGRPPMRSLIVNSNGGSTAYIGARSSEQYGRVYDKGIESKTLTAGRWWRWEVELKGHASWSMASQLSRIDEPGVMICATVANWFRVRTSHTYTSSLASGTIVGSPHTTSIDAKLSWLARGVRPTVQFLVERVGLDRVLFALGLPPQSAVAQQVHASQPEEEVQCRPLATFTSTPSCSSS